MNESIHVTVLLITHLIKMALISSILLRLEWIVITTAMLIALRIMAVLDFLYLIMKNKSQLI